MFIERIDVERFGALSRTVIEGLGPGVQVLYGTNETGKTTLLEFVRAMFFGFEGLFRRGVLDPREACAGRLHLRTLPERSLVGIQRRHEGPHLGGLSRRDYLDDVVGLGGDIGDLIEITELESPADVPRHRIYVQDLVGGIDERTFTNVMAFGLDELHELRTLEPEGCGSRLYELACGLDRTKVARVLGHLRDAIARLDSNDPAVSPRAALAERRHALAERMAGFGRPAVIAGGLWAESAHVDAEIRGLEARVAEAVRAENVVRAVLPLEGLHAAWRGTAARLAELDAAPLVHADRDAWRYANRRLKRLEKSAALKKKRRAKTARELRLLPGESAVWRHRVAVAALLEEQPRLERLAADVARAEAHARLAARRFGEQVAAAGLTRLVNVATVIDATGDAPTDVLLPEGFAHSFGPLRARARECARTSRRRTEARRELAAARRGLADLRGSVQGAGRALGVATGTALEQAGDRAAVLRRRIAAGERFRELEHTVTRLEDEVRESLADQLIPVPWLIALGLLFVVGTGMLLSGLLLPETVTGSLSYTLAALGLVGTGVSSVTTWSIDRTASARLEAMRGQLEMARKQRDETLAQCEAFDAALPADAVESLERRLTAAQAEVVRLEALALREGSVQSLAERVAVAEQALADATAARTEARGRWRKALEHRGLPPTLSPREVKQIAAHRHTLLTLDDDRRRLSDEARTKREEVAAFTKQIDALLVECEIVPESTPLEHLRLLDERLTADKSAVRRRGQLTRRLEYARRRHRNALRLVRVAERAVREFFTRWGVTTEEAFRARVDRRGEYEQARQDAETAETAWLDARRRTSEPAEIDAWLVEGVPLETRLAAASAVTVRHRAALAEAQRRRDALATRLTAAATDRITEGLQTELASVEEQLARQHDRRRVLERARILLEQTRAAVAREHQPPVLREASRWLARLTDGRYTRITTAIDEARLDVHENDGALWNPERLSRGTREQVFLALRLALIRDLGRHDVSLPLIMDDALVNFDDVRARLAARVLVEFITEQSAGRQMLVLTCHHHVARIFHDAGGHVRSFADPAPLFARRVELPPVVVAPPPPVVVEPPPVVFVEPPVVVPPVVVPPVVVVPPPRPRPRPVPPPAPVVVRQPAPELWPAEAYFFGPNPVYVPPARRNGPSLVRTQPAAPALRPPRRPPRRHAARPRIQRR
jgi:uncharacterized protein YhaN